MDTDTTSPAAVGTSSPAAAPPVPARQWLWLWRYPWAVVLAPLVVFIRGIAGPSLYAPGDGAQLFVPWFIVSARSWLSGHLPTWNPWAQSGMPLLASGQAGTLYPPNLLFLVLTPTLANNLGIVVTFVIAGLGAWLLARRLTGDGVAAAVGGLGFGLCSFLFAHIGHQSLIAGAAWLPWMLLGYELVRERFTPSRLLLGAAAVALAAFSGHSQIFFMDLLVLAVYVAASAFLGKPDRPVRSALVALLLVATGLGLSAVHLLPTALVAQASVRHDLSYAGAMTFSLPIRQLPMLVFPYLFGKSLPGGPYASTYGGVFSLTELSGYPGLALLVLAFAGMVALRADRRARALVAVGAFCLVMAVGPATPLSRVVFRLPVYGQFRAWGRYIYGVDLAVAMLGAYGVKLVRSGTRQQRRLATVLAVAAGTAAVVAALWLPHLRDVSRLVPGGKPVAAALLIPCAFALAAVLGAAGLIRTRAGALLIVAVVAADLFFSFGGFYEWRQVGPTAAAYRQDIATPATPWGGVATAPGGIGRYLYIGTDARPIGLDFVDVTDAKRLRSVNADNVLMAKDYSDAIGMTDAGLVLFTEELWRPTSHVLDLLRVTTVVLNPEFARGGPGPSSLLANGRPAGGLVRYEYQPKLPEAFLVGSTSRTNLSSAFDDIHGSSPFDPAAVALLDGPCPRCPTGPPGPAGTAGSVTWGVNRVGVTVDATRPALLVLSQAWSAGWEALIDGQVVPVVRVDGLVQGVPVPAGSHRVELAYRAPGLRTGFLITLGTLAAILLMAALSPLRTTLRKRVVSRSGRPDTVRGTVNQR
jgi:hypothetical protein